MTTIGPRHPDESPEAYLDRVVRTAGLPTPEQHARMAALLGPLGRAPDRMPTHKEARPAAGYRTDHEPASDQGAASSPAVYGAAAIDGGQHDTPALDGLACPDCRSYFGPVTRHDDGHMSTAVYHDATCPWFRRIPA